MRHMHGKIFKIDDTPPLRILVRVPLGFPTAYPFELCYLAWLLSPYYPVLQTSQIRGDIKARFCCTLHCKFRAVQ